MAIENNDLFVVQKAGGGELRKASVAALLADAVNPNYLPKPGSEGDYVVSEAADGTITFKEEVDGGTY